MVNALVSLLLPNLATGAQSGAAGGGLLAANPFDGMGGALNFSSFLDLQGKPLNPAQLPELLGTIKEEGGFETLLNLPDMELPDFEKIESLDQAIVVAAVIFQALPTAPEPVLTTGGTEAVALVDGAADASSMSPEEFVADIIAQMKQTIPGLTFGVLKPALQTAAPVDAAAMDTQLETVQDAIQSRLLTIPASIQPAAVNAAGVIKTESKTIDAQEEAPDLTAAVQAPSPATDTPDEAAEKATAALTATVVPLLAATTPGTSSTAQPVTAEQIITQKMGTALVADASITEEEAAAAIPETIEEKKILLKTSAAPAEEDEELIKKKDDKKEDKGGKLEASTQAVQQQTDEPAKHHRLQADTSIKSVAAEDGSSNQQSSTGDRQHAASSSNSIQQQVQSLLQADNNKDTAETSFMKMVREAQGQHHAPVADQISINIKHAIHNQSDNIRIQLSPHDLGAVDITLTMKGDEVTHIRVLAEKAETLDMLQRDSRFLERSLQESGLKADSGSLQFGLKGEQGGNAQNSGQDANGNRKYQPHYGMTGAAEEETKPLAWQEIGGTDVLIASTGINIRV